MCKLNLSHTLLPMRRRSGSSLLAPPHTHTHSHTHTLWFAWDMTFAPQCLSSPTPHKVFSIFKHKTCCDSVFLGLPPPFLFQECISSYTDCHRLHFTNSGCLKVKFTAHPPEPQQPTLIFHIILIIVVSIISIIAIIQMCKVMLFGE